MRIFAPFQNAKIENLFEFPDIAEMFIVNIR